MAYKKPNMDQSIAGRDRLPVTGTPFWKPPTGGKKYQTTWIRILPLAEDDPTDEFCLLLPLHYIKIGANKRTIVCRNLSTEGVERCPICEAAREQFNQGRKDAAKELRATWRALVNMIVIDADEGKPLKDEGIQVWAMSKETYLDLIDEIEKLPKDDRDITDPETGRDVYVDRKGSDQYDTRYKIGFSTSGAAAFPAVELLEPDDALFNLAEVHTSYDADTVLAMLEGGAAGPDPFDGLPEGEGGQEQAALPAPRNQRVAPEPEPEPEDPEGAGDEPPEDGAEPEEAAPEPKRRAATRSRGRTAKAEGDGAGEARERLKSATARRGNIARNARPEAEGDNE